ncbi:uncharacterized protein LOC109858861 isoform X1 [Pseudomyrmex gracilis]|uniref:uncharacterized protein LOC109858861 isoform X1 n=1 Tax=Pseudomyrmex gracilis TaxID=219809 RepID=UPI000995343A|nr:uncharacterized protein LOC109858861 isoform X1 [Pseudomyrmex gracilis]
MFLTGGVDVNTNIWNGTTSFHDAIENKEIGIAELVLNHGADINASNVAGDTLLHLAVRRGHVDDVKMLLDKGANVNALSYVGTPLHDAIQNKEIEIAKLLLNHGANVDATNYLGDTPLCFAIRRGHVDGVKLLIDGGTDVNAETYYGRSPLHDAIEKKETEIAKLLLNHGANVNINFSDGVTPLFIAVRRGYVDDVKMLIDRGANVNAATKLDITPLHDAIVNGEIEIAKLLLNHGADIHACTSTFAGDTPLSLAITNPKKVKLVTMLLDRGADINAISDVNNSLCLDNVRPRKIAKILERHIVKMKSANLYVSEQLLSTSSNYKIRNLQDKCEKELAIMKNEKISNTNISFYDILIKDTNLLAKCMRNENLVQVLGSDDYKTKFPIYASMINCNFRKGMEKKELLEQSTRIFYFLFNNFPKLPHICIEKIFSYLSDNDLRIVIDTCKPSLQVS